MAFHDVSTYHNGSAQRITMDGHVLVKASDGYYRRERKEHNLPAYVTDVYQAQMTVRNPKKVRAYDTVEPRKVTKHMRRRDQRIAARRNNMPTGTKHDVHTPGSHHH